MKRVLINFMKLLEIENDIDTSYSRTTFIQVIVDGHESSYKLI